uniref:Coatomer WD associated region domain-containing protein n=1 Tax=Ditylenchus dipsaci TaxID=166011 RepID=A0A915DNM3_9BILA
MIPLFLDGERLTLSVKDMGACEVYPQTLQHSSNGRFVVACGDGEYIIYTATALRNKAFGSGLEFVWATDPSLYAVRESSTLIKIFKNFKESTSLRPDIVIDGIDGGHLLAVKSSSSLCFYDWESTIAGEESFYILKYNADAVANANLAEASADGIEEAFEVIGDCFIFTTLLNRLSYYVGGELVTVAHLDRPLYLLGFIPKDNRIYASDKDHNIVSYKLLLSVLEYQTAVMRRDFDAADTILRTIPESQCTRVAYFLEKQGFKKQALAVSKDPEHRFELALLLGDLNTAFELAQQADSEEKWKQVAQVATMKSELLLAGECLGKAHDYGGLLMLASCAGSAKLMNQLANDSYASGQHNVSFLSNLLLSDVEKCIDILVETGRLPEAAFFAHTYCPSQVPRLVALWRVKSSQALSGVGKKGLPADV